VIIYEKLPDNRVRFLKAANGEIISDEARKIVFKLFDGTMEEPAREGENTSVSATFKTYIVKMGLDEDEEGVPKKMADYTFTELLAKIGHWKRIVGTASPMMRRDIRRRISITLTEASERLVFTFCALAFVMIGMPLGIVAHRGETSVGAAISLGLVGLNYAFIICVEALQERAWLYPYVLVWIPNVVFVILGPWLTWRLDRR
jgi:lipopolysaccharide export LptBFGC system permease protein LptF